MDTLAAMEPEEDETPKMVPQPGPGDRALWGSTSIGAIWVVQRGKHMLSVTLAGELGDGSRYRASLSKLAGLAAGRL